MTHQGVIVRDSELYFFTEKLDSVIAVQTSHISEL